MLGDGVHTTGVVDQLLTEAALPPACPYVGTQTA